MHKLIYPKVATDMFLVQLFWAFGYLGIVIMIHIIRVITSFVNDSEPSNFFATIYFSSNIFMLVIGIIGAYGFLEYFVGNGVTRRDYFKGSAIAAVGLSMAIPIVTSIVTVIETAIFKYFNVSFKVENFSVESWIDNDDGFIGDFVGNVVQTVVFSPFIDLNDNWILAICGLALNIFFYYLIGWFISAAFQQLGAVLGLGSILVAIAFVFIQDLFLRTLLGLQVNGMLEDVQVPLIGAVLGVFLTFIIILSLIRQLTKKVPINI